MHPIEKRALFHHLRMNWLNDSSLSVEPWQVDNYRDIPLNELFERLQKFGIELNRVSFITFADDSDSPEELTDYFIGGEELPTNEEDSIYLIVFELWRRLVKEKPSASILCHEVDYQIYLYDHHLLKDVSALQDALFKLSEILEKNVDEGVDPKEAIHLISPFCASDIETFLYDFISDQIEEGDESYAKETLDIFDPYLSENKWFKLLRIRVFGYNYSKQTQKIIEEIVEDHSPDNDLEFNLEFLSILTGFKENEAFKTIAISTIDLLKTEEDFQDFLLILIDYFNFVNQPAAAKQVKCTLDKRVRTAKDIETIRLMFS